MCNFGHDDIGFYFEFVITVYRYSDLRRLLRIIGLRELLRRRYIFSLRRPRLRFRLSIQAVRLDAGPPEVPHEMEEKSVVGGKENIVVTSRRRRCVAEIFSNDLRVVFNEVSVRNYRGFWSAMGNLSRVCCDAGGRAVHRIRIVTGRFEFSSIHTNFSRVVSEIRIAQVCPRPLRPRPSRSPILERGRGVSIRRRGIR